MSSKRQKTSPSSSSSSSRSKAKKKKSSKSGRSALYPAFYNGQTEADTAKVREQTRAIAEGMRRDADHMADLGEALREREDNAGETLLLKKAREVDDNFGFVNRNREAIGDAQNLTRLHDVVITQVNVASNYTQLKTADVLRHLHRKFHVDSFDAAADDDDVDGADPAAYGPRTDLDWVKLGKACAALFKAPPVCGLLRGAFSTGEFQAQQKKKRKRTTRKQEDPRLRKSIQEMAEEDEEDDPTTKLTQSIHDTLEKLQTNSGNKKQGMFEVLVDPTSFEKTVENLFAASFLVKDGKMDVQVSNPKHGASEGIPMISALKGGAVHHGASQVMATQADETNSGDVENCVVSLNIHDWEKICHAVNPESGVWEPKIDRPDVVMESSDSEEGESVTESDDEDSDEESGSEDSDE
jgi:hypothetical protein